MLELMKQEFEPFYLEVIIIVQKKQIAQEIRKCKLNFYIGSRLPASTAWKADDYSVCEEEEEMGGSQCNEIPTSRSQSRLPGGRTSEDGFPSGKELPVGSASETSQL